MSAPIAYAGRTWATAREWCLWIMRHNSAPAPAQNGQNAALDAFRAEVLREAADLVAPEARTCGCSSCSPLREKAAELRRMAEGAGQAGKDTRTADESTRPTPETLHGRLDRQNRTWTHGTGHVMDLSHGWQDCEGRHWRWDDGGAPHPVNGPYMRAAVHRLREPLDVVLALWGPITPLPADGVVTG